MICSHNLTAILLGLSYCIEGFRSNALVPSLLPVIVLFTLYLPIGRMTVRAVFSREQDQTEVATIRA
jgi:hypothetical protein